MTCWSAASIEIADEEAPDPGSTPKGQGPSETMDPEQLEEHLRRLNPEDFGRFTP